MFVERPQRVVPQFTASVDPILQRVYAARGLQHDRQLVLSLADLLPPSGLLNIEQAVQLLCAQLPTQRHILIVADFDADGATSCALAVLCLQAMGFTRVSYLVPNRFEFGYGLTPEIVEVAREREPHLIMTVDNGIASHAGIALARSLGIDVLVTDHHLPADTLPDANCILNPNQPGCSFASKAMAGVGVVFYLMSALRAELRRQDWFVQQRLSEPNMAGFLDLVALGTVADVVPLDQNNRRLVNHGLQIIRSGRGRAGITALLEVAGRNPAAAVANDLGFAAGPRLNAAGRLDDMSHGIACLLADEDFVARNMALELDALNKDRKLIEHDMQLAALEYLRVLQPDQMPDGKGRLTCCLYDATWHQGVIGILASRIKDRLHLPVIVFANAGPDAQGREQIKGSARSIPGIHIRDMLDAVATRNPGLLSKFGGHAMAAGLSILRDDFAAFRSALEQEVQAQTTPELFARQTFSDGALDDRCFSLEFAAMLRAGGPWGQLFPEPVFHGDFGVVSSRVLAGKHRKLVLQVPGTDQVVDAIAFNQEPASLELNGEQVRILYKLDINDYRGQQSPQLIVEKLEFIPP